MLHRKFQLKWPCGLREDVRNRISRWWLWWLSWTSDWHNFSSFRSRSRPVATEQVRLKVTKGLGKDVKNLFSRGRLWLPFSVGLGLAFFVSSRCPYTPHQVSAQLDHSLYRRCPKYESLTCFPHKCIGPMQLHGGANLTLPQTSMQGIHFCSFGRPPVPDDLCKDYAQGLFGSGEEDFERFIP